MMLRFAFPPLAAFSEDDSSEQEDRVSRSSATPEPRRHGAHYRATTVVDARDRVLLGGGTGRRVDRYQLNVISEPFCRDRRSRERPDASPADKSLVGGVSR
jgi:hypothetical protein